MIVADASLATKWVMEERESEQALRLVARYALHAPDLIMVEVAGAIVRRTNERLLTPDESARFMADWLAFQRRGVLSLHRSGAELLGGAATIAVDLGHPLKDCVYLALAAELECPLVTCDAKFRDRAGKRYGPVLLLSEVAEEG